MSAVTAMTLTMIDLLDEDAVDEDAVDDDVVVVVDEEGWVPLLSDGIRDGDGVCDRVGR
jgi:hypothetical protein